MIELASPIEALGYGFLIYPVTLKAGVHWQGAHTVDGVLNDPVRWKRPPSILHYSAKHGFMALQYTCGVCV